MPSYNRAGNIFFLVYDPRSGSTLLASHLVAYDDIDVSIESNFMRPILTNQKTVEAFDNSKQLFDHLVGLKRIGNLKLDEQALIDWLHQEDGRSATSIARASSPHTDFEQDTVILQGWSARTMDQPGPRPASRGKIHPEPCTIPRPKHLGPTLHKP